MSHQDQVALFGSPCRAARELVKPPPSNTSSAWKFHDLWWTQRSQGASQWNTSKAYLICNFCRNALMAGHIDKGAKKINNISTMDRHLHCCHNTTAAAPQLHQEDCLCPRGKRSGTIQDCQMDCRPGTPIQHSGEANIQKHYVQSLPTCKKFHFCTTLSSSKFPV
jgi:hypothetical protein